MALKRSKKDKHISKSHSYSPRQEEKFAKEYGADMVVNSGRGFKKGDSTMSLPAKIAGETLDLMIDNKATIKKSYSVTTKILTKLIEQALSENKLPMLHVELKCDTMMKEEFVVLPKITFDELMGKLK